MAAERRRFLSPAQQPALSLALRALAVLLASSTSSPAVAFDGVPERPMDYHGSGHWTSRSAGSGISGDYRGYSSDDRVVDEGSRAQLERQVTRELRETFGDEFCRQLEEESDVLNSVHEEKARIGREAGCTPNSPLSSSDAPLPRDSLHLPPLRARDPMGGSTEGAYSGVSGPMADWLK